MAERRLDLDLSEVSTVTVIERIGRTISDLSGRPLVLEVVGFFGWGPYGRVSPSVVIVAEGSENLQDLALDPDRTTETGASVKLRATSPLDKFSVSLHNPQYLVAPRYSLKLAAHVWSRALSHFQSSF